MAAEFCNLCLNISEHFGASIATLQLQHSFMTHLNLLQPGVLVKEFAAVIGQDGQLIYVGDYVELYSPQYEVCQSDN